MPDLSGSLRIISNQQSPFPISLLEDFPELRILCNFQLYVHKFGELWSRTWHNFGISAQFETAKLYHRFVKLTMGLINPDA